MRLLVCGGRKYANREYLFRTLDSIPGITEIVTGAQRFWSSEHRRWIGADWLAIEWALDRQVPFIGKPAQWRLLGDSAGPVRNAEMLSCYKPDKVVAFEGGRGTADMVRRSRQAGIEVIRT